MNDPTPKTVKRRCLKAVRDEPEFPGEMPLAMWNELDCCDKQTLTTAIRLIVMITKKGIYDRINKIKV